MKTVIYHISGSYLSVTETWIYGQIKNLRTYQPVIYALNTENLDIYPTRKIRSLELRDGVGDLTTFFNKGWNKVFGFYPLFAFYLMKDKPNLVHAHFGPSGYNFLKLKRIFKIPLVTTFYGFDLSVLPNQHPVWQKRYKELFRQGDRFFVEGSHMKKCLMDLGCPEDKITVQHLGIDLNQIKFVPRKPKKSGNTCVLIAGSFREKKGIPYAIAAFGKVKQAYPQLKLKLTIIGDSTGILRDEKEKKKILETIKKYELKDCVRMLGYQPYSVFLRELEKHHIFLSPSIHASDGDAEGGAPVSIIEASASGMPVLSTTHCDIPEIIIDKENGYLVPERDTDALVEKLGFLVSDPDTWEQMGRKGREHIEKNYNITTQVQKLEEIYDMVVRRRK